ncbi:MAG: hypothetical protein H7X95_09290 [Deltaproteobacteria bacterium]|nr:hypothetical protein [Deltaproteobacteria bacterium]
MTPRATPRPRPARGPILILSAFAPELAPLRLTLKRAAVPMTDVVCVAAGIGAIDAAIGASRAIAECGPRIVVFVGTAGSYGAAPGLGGCAIGRCILLASTAAIRGDGYLPAPMVMREDTDAILRRALVRSAHATTTTPLVVDVATPLAITTSATLARRLATSTGAGTENLEAFAVGRAATLAKVPFGVVLGISNRVGPRAHVEWLHHRDRATNTVCRVVEQFLVAARVLKGPIRSAPK